MFCYNWHMPMTHFQKHPVVIQPDKQKHHFTRTLWVHNNQNQPAISRWFLYGPSHGLWFRRYDMDLSENRVPLNLLVIIIIFPIHMVVWGYITVYPIFEHTQMDVTLPAWSRAMKGNIWRDQESKNQDPSQDMHPRQVVSWIFADHYLKNMRWSSQKINLRPYRMWFEIA
jgi:hypothetical protein